MADSRKNLKPWKPGQSGNPSGRPKGSRNKLSEAFLKDLLSAWNEHGPEVLQKLAAEKPGEFARIIAMVIPKSVNVSADHTISLESASVQEVNDFLGGLLREEENRDHQEAVH